MEETRDPVHGGEAERGGDWTWRPPRGEHFRTCSYCGSIHPEDLAAEDNWHAEWADAKYGWPHKFYAAIRNRNPDQQFIVSATTDGQPPADFFATYQWLRTSELPEDVNTDGWRDLADRYQWIALGTRPVHHAKFYTVHLADPALPPDAAEAVQRVSGLRFGFRDGQVTWQRYEPTA